MTHRVDAMENWMEVARPDSAVNRFFTESAPEQLPPGHHPLLPPRQVRDWPSVSARPRQPFLKTG